MRESAGDRHRQRERGRGRIDEDRPTAFLDVVIPERDPSERFDVLVMPNLYGDLTIFQANQGPYQNTLAYLDAEGKSHASIDIASIVTPLAVGQILHHAYFVFQGGSAIYVSDPVETKIVF